VYEGYSDVLLRNILLPVISRFTIYTHCSSELGFTVKEVTGFAEYRTVENVWK